MAQKYITYNDFLCNKLSLLGFKRKGQHDFIRKCDDFTQTLSFQHAVSQSHSRDYTILVSIRNSLMEKIGHDTEVYFGGGWSVNIGYLTPCENYKEWFVENSAPNDVRQEIIDDIISNIETYAIPFLNKYSDIKELIHGIEEGNRFLSFQSEYKLPILYFLNGECDLAIAYMNEALKRKSTKAAKVEDDYPRELLKRDERSNTPQQREYDDYKEFVDKVKSLIAG
jgi:hypothetical protein